MLATTGYGVGSRRSPIAATAAAVVVVVVVVEVLTLHVDDDGGGDGPGDVVVGRLAVQVVVQVAARQPGDVQLAGARAQLRGRVRRLQQLRASPPGQAGRRTTCRQNKMKIVLCGINFHHVV